MGWPPTWPSSSFHPGPPQDCQVAAAGCAPLPSCVTRHMRSTAPGEWSPAWGAGPGDCVLMQRAEIVVLRPNAAELLVVAVVLIVPAGTAGSPSRPGDEVRGSVRRWATPCAVTHPCCDPWRVPPGRSSTPGCCSGVGPSRRRRRLRSELRVAHGGPAGPGPCRADRGGGGRSVARTVGRGPGGAAARPARGHGRRRRRGPRCSWPASLCTRSSSWSGRHGTATLRSAGPRSDPAGARDMAGTPTAVAVEPRRCARRVLPPCPTPVRQRAPAAPHRDGQPADRRRLRRGPGGVLPGPRRARPSVPAGRRRRRRTRWADVAAEPPVRARSPSCRSRSREPPARCRPPSVESARGTSPTAWSCDCTSVASGRRSPAGRASRGLCRLLRGPRAGGRRYRRRWVGRGRPARPGAARRPPETRPR